MRVFQGCALAAGIPRVGVPSLSKTFPRIFHLPKLGSLCPTEVASRQLPQGGGWRMRGYCYGPRILPETVGRLTRRGLLLVPGDCHRPITQFLIQWAGRGGGIDPTPSHLLAPEARVTHTPRHLSILFLGRMSGQGGFSLPDDSSDQPPPFFLGRTIA